MIEVTNDGSLRPGMAVEVFSSTASVNLASVLALGLPLACFGLSLLLGTVFDAPEPVTLAGALLATFAGAGLAIWWGKCFAGELRCRPRQLNK